MSAPDISLQFHMRCKNCEWEGDNTQLSKVVVVSYGDEWWECPSCGIQAADMDYAPATDVDALRKILRDNPEEALHIAEQALLGLLIETDTTQVIGADDEYLSGADYIDHVVAGIQNQPKTNACILQLQAESEETNDE